MPHCTNQVRPRIRSKSDISGAVAAAWGRLVNKHGRGALADKLDIEVKTINRALTGETTPQLSTAFNALAIDPTALDEIAALFGMRLCPVMSCPADDADTVARMAGIVSEWVRLGHGRDHRDTCRLADLARDILPALMALVFEADSVRGRA